MSEKFATPISRKLGLVLVFIATVLVASPLQAQDQIPTALIAWSPDGEMLAVGSGTTVSILDRATLQTLNTLTGFADQLVEPAWSPEGEKLAVTSYGDIQIWNHPWDPNQASQTTLYRYYSDRNPAQPTVSVDAVVWSPDGQRVASSFGSVIDIWDVTTGARIRRIIGDWDRVPDLAWSTDNRLAMANVDSIVTVFDPDTGNPINYFNTSAEIPPPGVWSIAFNSSEDKMVVGRTDATILIWDNTQTPDFVTYQPSLIITGHDSYIWSVSWSPTGDYIASGSGDGTVRLWDATTGEALQVIDLGQNVQVNSVAFSPDGTKLAYGKLDGTVAVIPVPDVVP